MTIVFNVHFKYYYFPSAYKAILRSTVTVFNATYSTGTREIQIISLLREVTQTRRPPTFVMKPWLSFNVYRLENSNLSWSTCINQKWNFVNSNTKQWTSLKLLRNCNVSGMQQVSSSSLYYKNLVVLVTVSFIHHRQTKCAPRRLNGQLYSSQVR